VKRVHRELKARGQSNLFIALAGTKSDLEEERKIPFADVKEFAVKEQIEVFLEVSSKTGANVEELFKQIAISSCFFMI